MLTAAVSDVGILLTTLSNKFVEILFQDWEAYMSAVTQLTNFFTGQYVHKHQMFHSLWTSTTFSAHFTSEVCWLLPCHLCSLVRKTCRLCGLLVWCLVHRIYLFSAWMLYHALCFSLPWKGLFGANAFEARCPSCHQPAQSYHWTFFLILIHWQTAEGTDATSAVQHQCSTQHW